MAGVAALLAMTQDRPVAAQGFSLSPQIGFYIPTENMYEIAQGQVGELEAGPSFGARLAYWLGSRFGIEATGAYVPTTFRLTSGSSVQKENASVITGNGQAVFFVLPRTSPVSLYLSGGVGVVSHGGVAFEDVAETTNLTGVVGAGGGVRLRGFTVIAGADLYAYSASFGGTTDAEAFARRDFQIKIGIGFPVGGRAGVRADRGR